MPYRVITIERAWDRSWADIEETREATATAIASQRCMRHRRLRPEERRILRARRRHCQAMFGCPNREEGSLAGLEMVMDVLLGGNGNAIPGRRAKAPGFERQKNLLIDRRSHAVQDALLGDVACFVYGDLDDHVAFLTQLPWIDCRVSSPDRQGRTNFFARQRPFRQRAVLRAGGGSCVRRIDVCTAGYLAGRYGSSFAWLGRPHPIGMSECSFPVQRYGACKLRIAEPGIADTPRPVEPGDAAAAISARNRRRRHEYRPRTVHQPQQESAMQDDRHMRRDAPRSLLARTGPCEYLLY